MELINVTMKDIRQIIKEFNTKVKTIEPITQNSFSSKVYRLVLETNEKVILKIPFSREKLFRESHMLQRLSDALPVPSVISLWTGDGKKSGAMLLSFIEGDPASDNEITTNLSFQMGKLLAKLHSIPMPDFGQEGEAQFIPMDWWSFIETKFTRILMNSKKKLPFPIYKKIYNYFQHFSTNYPSTDGPCVIHCDYRPGNIMVQNGQVTGLIDFESSRGGSADFDFSKMKLHLQKIPHAWESFLQGYKKIRPLPNLEILLNFNILFHALNHIEWCLKRETTDHEKFLSENIDIVKAVVREI